MSCSRAAAKPRAAVTAAQRFMRAGGCYAAVVVKERAADRQTGELIGNLFCVVFGFCCLISQTENKNVPNRTVSVEFMLTLLLPTLTYLFEVTRSRKHVFYARFGHINPHVDYSDYRRALGTRAGRVFFSFWRFARFV